MPGDKSQKESLDPSISFGASQSGAFFSSPRAAGSEAIREGMDLLREGAHKAARRLIDKKQGNLFEYIEAAKFNSDAALKGASLRAHVTEAQGSPHTPVDIEITYGNKVIMEVQAKSMSDPKVATVKLSQPKYRGMGKLVPKGQEIEVRRISEKGAERGNIYAEDYEDTARNIRGELKAGEVSSPGTSYQENMEAAQSPNWYAAKQQFKYVAKEGGTAAGYAAAAGFIVKGAISGMKNAVAVLKGEITGKDAVVDTMKDAA